MHISKSKRCFNVKSSTYYLHVKTKILTDFQICINVPLMYIRTSVALCFSLTYFSVYCFNFCAYLDISFYGKIKLTYLLTYLLPSRHEMSLRDLYQISIERDISETSKKHLKRDDFFVTSLRRLKNISKKMSFV